MSRFYAKMLDTGLIEHLYGMVLPMKSHKMVS